MSYEVQSKGAARTEATEGGPSICVGIPTVNLANNEVALYYDIDPPSCWRRLLVFLRGLMFGLTLYFCCPAMNRRSDDLSWGRRLFVIGSTMGGAIGGGIIGFSSVFFGCWAGSELAVSVSSDDDSRTGCRVGGWSLLAFGLCYMILVVIRRMPKAVFRSSTSTAGNNDEAETELPENE